MTPIRINRRQGGGLSDRLFPSDSDQAEESLKMHSSEVAMRVAGVLRICTKYIRHISKDRR